MELAGSTSWRFAESAGDHLPHVALFVRDATGLPVPPGPAVPPRLTGAVPDHHDLLSQPEREDAGRQWVGWWSDVLGVDRQEAADRELHAFPRGAYERAGAPPDFAALADRPALRRAVVATFPDAHRWVGRRRRSAGAERQGSFTYGLVRQVAEDVAFDRSVDIGRVRAGAVVLHVEGVWWHLLVPGTVVCSTAATEDPVAAQQVLRQAFESGLRR